MGPLEMELRVTCTRTDWWRMSYEAFCLVLSAEQSLGVPGPFSHFGKTDAAQAELDALMPDVFSEAIEAAEALGL